MVKFRHHRPLLTLEGMRTCTSRIVVVAVRRGKHTGV